MEKEQKICFLIYDFSNMGGAERAAAKLMNELAKQHKIVMISIFNRKQECCYEMDDKIEKVVVINGEGSMIKKLPQIVSKVRKTIKQSNTECLLAIDVATAFIGFLGTLLLPVKFIMCDRSSCYNKDMYSKWILRFYAWIGAKFSHKYQVMTQDGKIGCIEKYRLDADKIIVIPNWLDREAINDNTYNFDNHKIITVGRAIPEKGYENMIEIAKRIKEKYPEWEWHIWGDFSGDYGDGILRKIKEAEVDDFLIYKGVSKDIYNIYPQYSLYVMTSRYEGMPNVLLEAQGSKLPIVSYNCKTGPSEIIEDGINGYLVEVGNTEEMYNKIVYIISNKEIAEKLSINCSKNLYKFRKETIIKKWIELIKN